MMKMLKQRNYKGRKTYDFILSQIRQCKEDLSIFFLEKDYNLIFTSKFISNLVELKKHREFIDPIELALLDISYTVVFIGVSKAGRDAIRSILLNYYSQPLIDCILGYISKKPHIDSDFFKNWQNLVRDHFIISKLKGSYADITGLLNEQADFKKLEREDGKATYFKYYGGHQYKLSHYYRHLFQTVKYINEKAILTYQEKYEYISLLRAQMSTPEQILFFFNSISSLGREWELKHLFNGKKLRYDCLLVSKYNLIRNIHDTKVANVVDLKAYYPFVNFEFDEKSNDRIKLEQKFT